MRHPVQGHCSARFEPLHRLFQNLFDTGHDVGASLAVVVDDAYEVDLWGGAADAEGRSPWRSDTVVNVWSTTKTVTSLAALMLVDRGLLDPDLPVARWWPEFAAQGKGDVTVRQVLSFTCGVSGWEQPVTLADLYDDADAAARLAMQAPWWTPGSATGYPALSFGHLVGELVRRVTGIPLRDFVREEIAQPMGADFWIGLPAELADRCSPVLPPPPLPIDLATLDPSSVMVRTFTGPAPDAAAANTAAWRAADLGACNGHGHARSVAGIQRVVSQGGEGAGRRLLSARTVDRIFETQHGGIDRVLGVPLHMGLGWGLPQPDVVPYVPTGRTAFWGGWGGSMVICDADRRMTFAYMMNRMAPGIVGGENVARLAGLAFELAGPKPSAT